MQRKARKWTLLSLFMAMTLSFVFAIVGSLNLPTTAIAQEVNTEGVAKVNDTYYDTFDSALTATQAMTGNVTVEIYEKVTLKTSFSGNYDSITFVGKSDSAEIYLEVQGYITAHGKNVSFENLILSKSVGGFITNAGFMNVAFGVYDVNSVTYTDCTFTNGAYASSGVVTFNGCTFGASHDKYGLWAYGDVQTTVEDCKFVGNENYKRGIKMYAEGQAKTVELTVENTDFSAVNDKPAIVLTYGESVTLSGNTYPAKGTLELDLGGAPNGTSLTSTDEITCINDNGDCGVIVDGKIYQTVADAAAVATDGSIVTLLHNSTETVALPSGAVLNKNGYTADAVTGAELNAVAKIGYNYYESFESALAAVKDGDTLTLLKDITISGKWNSRNKTDRPMTINGNDKTIKFTGEINDGYNYLSAFTFASAVTVKNLTLDMSEAISVFQNRFSAISALSDITVDNCTFIGSTTYTNARAIIYGEKPYDTATITGSLNVSISGCTFTNWRYGVTDEMNAKDSAKNVVITDSTFTSASAQLSACESVNFSDNSVDKGFLDVTSYTNVDNYTVSANNNNLDDNNGIKPNAIEANPSNITTDNDSLKPVAKLGDTFYASMEDLLAVIVSGNTLSLTEDLTAYSTLILPADVTVKANGNVINGTVSAGGNVTFADHVKVTAFTVEYTGLTINIIEGACLEVTGGSRVVIGHNTTFNITGSITDAKTADLATLQPSLYVKAGASFSGNGVNFNATNAYVKFDANSTSKNTGAYDTFNFNLTNCVWDQTNKLAFSVPVGLDPTFNMNFKDSVLKTTGHIVFAVSKGEIVFDNSYVNKDNAKQLEIRSTVTLKNGSIVHAIDATSQNANKPGTLIVENATYVGSDNIYTGGILGDSTIGNLILMNGANVTLNDIAQTNVYKYAGSSLVYSNGDPIDTNATKKVTVYDMVSYKLSLATDKTALKANESLTATVSIDKAYYSAEYTFTYDASKFSCAQDADADGVIYVTNLYKGQAGDLATYTLVAKNDINSVSNGNVIAVSGNAIQYKEQALSTIENVVEGCEVSINISLNYTAEVYADYVSGYTLVLVKGADAGYAYNGIKMFYVEAYGAYAVLVEGAVTAEVIELALTKATNCETISPSYDVNAEFVKDGKVDLKDATAVYACSILDFEVADYMELFLRADVNGDYRVDYVDVNQVTANYTK